MQNLAHIRKSLELPLSFCFFLCRNVLGTKNLGDILSERESIANMMQSTLVKIEKNRTHHFPIEKINKIIFFSTGRSYGPVGRQGREGGSVSV